MTFFCGSDLVVSNCSGRVIPEIINVQIKENYNPGFKKEITLSMIIYYRDEDDMITLKDIHNGLYLFFANEFGMIKYKKIYNIDSFSLKRVTNYSASDLNFNSVITFNADVTCLNDLDQEAQTVREKMLSRNMKEKNENEKISSNSKP